ncbi:MAG: type VII secretion protein EssC [Eubacterium sp.]|nr:type VII secretion protein EssC [Eubacterium sp.]
MKLTLLSNQEISNLTLPEKYVGQYWLRSRNKEGKLTDVVSVEAQRGTEQWILKSNRRFSVIDKDGKSLQNTPLQPLELYRIQSADGSIKFTLYTEPITDNRRIYSGYTVTDAETVLTIGRNERNAVCYKNKFVSDSHAELSFSTSGIFVKDLGSTNNTYVNEKSVKEARLFNGDVIYIMGLRIIITNKCLFLNNPDGNVRVQANGLKEFHAPIYHTNLKEDEEFEDVPEQYYYRAPRFKKDIETFNLKVDPPPADQNKDEMPMVMLIGPSVTMGMASVATGIFTVTSAIERGNVSSAIPSLVMCISMLLGTLMWPLITKTYQRRLNRRKEIKRQESYTAYINALEQIIAAETAYQEMLLRENDIGIEACISRALTPNPQLWERTPKHTDFLQIRLGIGNLPLKANIQYSERKFTTEPDNLTEMMYRFCEKKRMLNNVPVCISLVERFISGIYGNRNILYPYVKSLILQTTILHSYDEVKLVLIYSESQEEMFSFARWLPHTMNKERTVRYIAADFEETKELSSELNTIIEFRKNLSENKIEHELPYYVIVCLDKELASKTECVRRVLEHKDNIKFSVLSAFENLADLPKECMAVEELSDKRGKLTFIGSTIESSIDFNIDPPAKNDLQETVNVLANTFVNINGSSFTLPKKYTFFEMLDIGMVEHLNLADNWAFNDPTQSLAATVGVDRYGEPFKLDLHERAHGPHGLVAGMTGSGKSEFIISYILSVAVSFHPYEVAFILIDYKGGGMAKSFENIPHTAGVITNLDGNGIKRSLSSLKSELHRREKIFSNISKKYNISNIDIYKYQKLYREGRVDEPLPHLLIVSDEFAELKKEQPEFMTELTSAARVGRSLGVHLILATQKPGGVVDDQIRSNSRFKVCLKVQDSSDSQEMLGRPEAAALIDTGRFYLQVGYNELFELGQSAWAGAPYYPSVKTIKDKDDSVSVINTAGRIIAEANINRFADIADPPKQLDVITNYIAKYCEEEHIKHWKMWLAPIPPIVYVDSLVEKYGDTKCESFELNPVVGEFDDPANQKQGILRIPMTSDGNVIVYGSGGSGKAMFIEAVCYSLMTEHTPDEVNIYIMDFGAETFTSFSVSPFVGDIILSHEKEKADNLFKLLIGKLETRKKLMSRSGGSLIQYNRYSDRPEPNIVVIVNNFAAFNEIYEEKTAELNYLTREGTKYGIYFIISCTGVNNIRFSMLTNFKLMYCLQMNNTDDYSVVVGKTDGLLPEKYIGRGIFRCNNGTLLEFQTACITPENPPYPTIHKFCQDLSEKYAGKTAASVPVLTEKVTTEILSRYIKLGDLSKVPVGFEKETLEVSYYDFSTSAVNFILSNGFECLDFSNALTDLIAEKYGVKTIILAPLGDFSTSTYTDNLQVYSSYDECFEASKEIYNTVLERNQDMYGNVSKGNATVYSPLFVVIKSFSQIKTISEHFAEEKQQNMDALDTPYGRLSIVLAKCVKEYNVHFVICESAVSLKKFSAEKWYRTYAIQTNGIWIGNGINSQCMLKATKKPREYSSNIDSDFGFVVKDDEAVLVKFLR